MKRIKPAAFIAFTVKPNIYGSVAAECRASPLPNISGLGTSVRWLGTASGSSNRLYRWGFKRSCVVFFQNRDDEQLFLARKIVRPDQAVGSRPASISNNSLPSTGLAPKASRFTFLLAARLLWHKGVREFVEAARAVRADHPNSRFQILGFVEPPGRDSVAGT